MKVGTHIQYDVVNWHYKFVNNNKQPQAVYLQIIYNWLIIKVVVAEVSTHIQYNVLSTLHWLYKFVNNNK